MASPRSISVFNPVRKTKVKNPGQDSILVVTDRVPTVGSGGGGTTHVYEYTMPVAQTTAIIDHNLGRDPVAVQVLLDGQECDEYSVTFPIPGQRVLVGFDVSVAATIRLI